MVDHIGDSNEKTEWVSVKDRLPEILKDVVVSEDVLIYAISNETMTFEKGEGYFAVDRFCVWIDGVSPSFRTDRFSYGTVTHWMPLPEPPKD